MRKNPQYAEYGYSQLGNRFLLKKRGFGAVFVMAMAAQPAMAALSEPQAIFYGSAYFSNRQLTAADAGYAVVAKYNGTTLDTFSMGENLQNLENQYVLRLPMDSVGTRQSAHARTGDNIDFYVKFDTAETLVASAVVGDRGSITQLTLGMVDVDGDGVDDDIDNCLLFNSGNQTDTDHDGFGDVCDDFDTNASESKDSDSDGMGDNFEQTNGFDRFNPADANQDADGDGINNLAEFNAGTNPRDVVIVPQYLDKDVPLPVWTWVLMSLLLGKLGWRSQRKLIRSE